MRCARLVELSPAHPELQ